MKRADRWDYVANTVAMHYGKALRGCSGLWVVPKTAQFSPQGHNGPL